MNRGGGGGDDRGNSVIAHQMPPQNLSTPTQQQQHQHPDQHQMSQTLVDQHSVVSMTDQHSAMEHAHSMAEHAAHSMLDLSETGSSLEHLAGGGHSSQSLVDLTTGRGGDQTLDSNGRRQNQMHDRLGLNEGPGRDLVPLGGGNRSISGLSGGSLSDRQNQPLRNLTPAGDNRGVHGGGLGSSLSSDGRGSVGIGGNGNGIPDQGGFNPEQSQNLLDSMSSRGRPPSMGGGQHNLGTVDQQHGGQQLPPHMRGLSDHPSHTHLVDHHSQQQGMGGDNAANSHNGRGGMSAYGMDGGNGQLHSRPGSTIMSDSNNRNDACDLSRAVYSTSQSSSDRPQGHHTTSLIEETIAAVASNLNKSPDGGLMPGPLPPNSMMGHLGTLGLLRTTSTGSHLGHGNDESLADLVGRHHSHGIPMLSERASQSLSGLMDDHSIGASSGHGPGRELEKTHPCLTCLKMFRSKQQLAQHSLVHTGVRKHVCSFCDRAFKQLSHLQQHVRIHTG
ncbi:hypothetical protein Btru_033149 [Bulinus truncatus]|nr:hypothetical protein Btru_033149 [Bulinus truncatus]